MSEEMLPRAGGGQMWAAVEEEVERLLAEGADPDAGWMVWDPDEERWLEDDDEEYASFEQLNAQPDGSHKMVPSGGRPEYSNPTRTSRARAPRLMRPVERSDARIIMKDGRYVSTG